MVNVTGDGRHYVNNDPLVPLSFYDGDERRRNCSGCHTHNRDNVTGNLPANMDGLMPVACNTCHTDPPAPGSGPPTHPLSATHNVHVVDYAFRCRTCHYQNNHNESGMDPAPPSPGRARPPPTSTSASTRRATAAARPTPARTPPRLPLPASAGPAPAPCSTATATAPTAPTAATSPSRPRSRGTKIAPAWSVAADGTCGTCHEIAAVSPQPLGTQAHPTHVRPVAGDGYAHRLPGLPLRHDDRRRHRRSSPGCRDDHPRQRLGRGLVQRRRRRRCASTGQHLQQRREQRARRALLRLHRDLLPQPGDRPVARGYADDPVAGARLGRTPPTCGSCHGGRRCRACRHARPVRRRHPEGEQAPAPRRHGRPASTADTNGYVCQVCHYPTTHDRDDDLRRRRTT